MNNVTPIFSKVTRAIRLSRDQVYSVENQKDPIARIELDYMWWQGQAAEVVRVNGVIQYWQSVSETDQFRGV